MPDRLVDRRPAVSISRLVADMVPPPRFADVTFGSYVTDPAQPTQATALRATRAFADQVGGRVRRFWPRRSSMPDSEGPTGLYLDGGFGVGKTHLLAATWHAADVAPERKTFCTFVELTNLVGALGFVQTVEALSEHRLICIDEFELDDPGDTVLITTLLSRLSERGIKIAATSNTLPDQLGEGRFAAEDFLREIQRLAQRFTVVRVDGADYRHGGTPHTVDPVNAETVTATADGPGVTLDDFDSLCAHLASVHPSKYGPMLDGVGRVHLRGVKTVRDQNTALRLVVLADRLYDRAVPVMTSGVPLDRVFADELLTGGYRKKYGRAISRLVALSTPSPADRVTPREWSGPRSRGEAWHARSRDVA